MSDAALQHLSDAQDALITALDAHDADAIETANAALSVAVQEICAAGGWRDRADLRERITNIVAIGDTARARINLLADRNRRNLDKLLSLAGVPRATPYGRRGQLI